MSEVGKTARVLVGKVVSNKMEKTVVVKVERVVAHPLYGKFIRRSSKVLAHDAAGECREGDTVQVQSTRPISKGKSWVVERVLAKAS
ncbi:30S ribosomal protein S17 [Methylotetracoccus oryzae]|uniref:30S ribosomal protein S17 n=1 Tax=Methylotetracoccus oryzae TaxID=1919059 RepID=UPI00111B408B|nr:30S ribosomal protein S17 [Methylotetracoccus oryzae]